ncbi:MAG: HIT family protein [Polyangiaceae bacterium]
MRHLSKAAALTLVAEEARAIDAGFDGCAMCAAVAAVTPRSELAADHEIGLKRSQIEHHSAEAIRASVLAEDDVAIAMLDRFAARPGHSVVVLRRHVESIAELPWDEYAAVQRLAWETARALTAALSPVRVYVAALGATRRIPMSFPHHHVHVIPLTDGGEIDRPASVLTWSHGVHVFEPGEMEGFAERVRAAWPR